MIALWLVAALAGALMLAVAAVFVGVVLRAESARYREFDRHMMTDAERARDSARIYEARARRAAWKAMKR